jgi:hypothetical protein
LPATEDIRGPRRRSALDGIAAGLLPCLIFVACAALDGRSSRDDAGEAFEPEKAAQISEQAGADRVSQLEIEIGRLRADLREAEESMVAIESGLRGGHSRADAVATLAESRIAVERASRDVPWRRERVQEARQKLEEAERQLQAGHTGSAVFFASRARRIAASLNAEAERVANTPGARFIHGRRVNLRAGPSTEDRILHVLVGATPVFPEREDGDWVLVLTPSGHVGWVHRSLLSDSLSSSSETTTQSLPAALAP